MHHTKRLTQALILSGTLNLGLIATFTYFVIKDKQAAVPIELKPMASQNIPGSLNNEELLRAYSQLPFAELLLRLENQELVEDGFRKRDLALSCMVAFHHFNLDAALGGLLPQKREVLLSHANNQERITLSLFPGVTPAQFEAVMRYARTEKWPLSNQGLFFEIKRAAIPRDPTLLEAFFHTSEFQMASLLFSRTGLPIEKEQLIEMLAQGDWAILQTFCEKQKLAQDLSLEARRTFLIAYLNCNAPLAAQLLLEADFEFTSKRMDDAELLKLFDLVNVNSPKLALLAKELLASPRSDAVWKRASSFRAPQPNVVVQKEAPSQQKRIHTVQKGDSLWKIAKQYKVSVKELMRANHLESEQMLRQGKKLEIPSS